MPTSLARRALLVLLPLAMVIAFVSTARSAQAEGKQGASVAAILAAESSAGAPVRPRATRAKASAKHVTRAAKAKAGHHATKAKQHAS